MTARRGRIWRTGLAAAMLAGALTPGAWAQDAGSHILFIRGAERSGGFLEAGKVSQKGGDADFSRTEQLADIGDLTTGANPQTKISNHGWGTLAQTLRDHGFLVTQIQESLRPDEPAMGQTRGAGVDLAGMDLSAYDAIVFGSNNATYDTADVEALEQYLRAGGGALFISDANFGGNWADASDSDQPFLDRLGLVANQDQGTYRITPDEFLVPTHPILQGLDAGFDGEGVTPVTVQPTLPEGVSVQILARAKNVVRRNDGTSGNRQGTSDKSPGDNDAALVAGTIGDGRFAWHFDRNTFFNQGGAGTDLTRFDNEPFALNLFRWLAGK